MITQIARDYKKQDYTNQRSKMENKKMYGK